MVALLLTALCTVTVGCNPQAGSARDDLTDEQVENLVRRSYPYVALFNVNNRYALDTSTPYNTGGWNRVLPVTALLDHEVKAIARPNNDTLFVVVTLDVTKEALVVEAPAFDSDYVSVMITALDHYVNIPMSTGKGDFSGPSRMLVYSENTPDFAVDSVEGIDEMVVLSGDYASATYRIMPHQGEPERMRRNIQAMERIRLRSLSEYLGDDNATAAQDLATQATDIPAFGRTDFEAFETNLSELMQFVFNHTSFDADDPLDQAVLEAWEPLGVVPGREFEPETIAPIDGSRFREAAEQVFREKIGVLRDNETFRDLRLRLFKPKGQMNFDDLVAQSVFGPNGMPAEEAVYFPINTADGEPMNANSAYVIHMPAQSLPPANAFWSATLYDTKDGFFIPNDRKKYSVGANAGMQLDADGGITIHVAAEQPPGVPRDNWLPLQPGDYGVDMILRIYAPDLDRYETWTPPVAEKVVTQ